MMYRNWAGNVAFSPERVETPPHLEGLQELVAAATRAGQHVRAVGAGHSFSPLIQTEDVLVSLDHFDDVGEADERGIVSVAGGIRLHALGQALFQIGRAQENLGDIDVQSIAGAVSTGTHGTGLSFGILSTQVEWLRILRADGEIEEIGRSQNPDAFRAAATSLGMLGLIVSVGLRTVPAYGLHVRQFAEDFENAVQSFETRIAAHRHHEFFWFPHTNTVLSKVTDAVETYGTPPGGLRRFVEDVVLENGVLEFFNRSAAILPRHAASINATMAFLSRIAGGKIATGPSHRIFATQRLCRFVEMEYALPLATLGAALERLRRWIADERIAVAFPVEVRCARGDDLWLSPAHERDTAFIAVHMHRALPHEKYFRGAEAIFRDFEGRPHWGKMHTLQAADCRSLYPKWNEFHALRRRFDPQGTFLNVHTQHMC